MMKTEHLKFVVLMIPTILVLVAAAASMVELELPVDPTYTIATAHVAVN